tara:strand:+ start:317 stop:661 length:345 start_codon:yes stop_codon:yes gene_type:complete
MASLVELYLEKDIKQFPQMKICNMKCDQKCNKKIFSRNVCLNGIQKNIPEYRSSYQVCGGYKDLNTLTEDTGSLQYKFFQNIVAENDIKYSVTEKCPKNTRNILIPGDNYTDMK